MIHQNHKNTHNLTEKQFLSYEIYKAFVFNLVIYAFTLYHRILINLHFDHRPLSRCICKFIYLATIQPKN